MKSMFRGYYPPSDDEMNKIWDEGLIVLDTNALLNILRYSASTRDELLDLLDKKKARIWIPYQVGLEFHKNRHGIPGQLVKAFEGVETAVSAALNDAENGISAALVTLRRHAWREADELGSELREHAKKLKKKVKRAKKQHAEAVTAEDVQTATFNRISELYEGRVGQPYDEHKLKEVFKDGQARYDKQIPPGYKDGATKKDDSKYGDYVLWRQILDYAKEVKKPLLFVTDDNKEDWWERISGKTIGARPELIDEYSEASDGERAHFYNLRRYLEFAKKRGENISTESVNEARRVSTHSRLTSSEAAARFMEQQARTNALMRKIAEIEPPLSTSESFNTLMAAMRRNLPTDIIPKTGVEELLKTYGDIQMSSINNLSLPRVTDYLFRESTPEERARLRAIRRQLDRQIYESNKLAHEELQAELDAIDDEDEDDDSDVLEDTDYLEDSEPGDKNDRNADADD